MGRPKVSSAELVGDRSTSMITVVLGLGLTLALLAVLAGALVCTLDRRREVLRHQELASRR